VESAVVPLEEKQLPPEPFSGKPFVFDFEIPVRPDPAVGVGQKDAAKGVTPTLDRVIDFPEKPGVAACYDPPVDERSWFLKCGECTNWAARAA
jgi:hypothetical protein